MEEEVYDVCVVGAGMFGSAAARHASTDPTLKVCLVGPTEPTIEDSKNRSIFSSHYDEGRIVQLFHQSFPWFLLSKHTISRLRELEKLSGIQFYNPVGFLLAFEKSDKTMSRLMESLVSNNVPFFDVSDNDAFERRFPYLQMNECDVRLFGENGAGYVSARKLVEAQKRVAGSNGCQITQDIVREVKGIEEGVHQIITENNRTIRAKKVLICGGAFTNYSRLQPSGKLKMTINKETVAMLRLSKYEAEILSSMPPTGYWKKRDDLPLLMNGAYILPPMQYPDGKFYLKAGREGTSSDPTAPSLEEIQGWYNSAGDLEIVNQLSCLLKQLFPNVNFEEVSGKTCLTCNSASGLPYIDRLTPTVSVAVVGNGGGAMISDEVGRLAAELSISGKWDSELPKDLFRAILE